MARIDRNHIVNIAKRYTDDDPIVREARGWLLDCFGGDEETAEYIESMTVYEVIFAVEKYYAGGWEHFVIASGRD